MRDRFISCLGQRCHLWLNIKVNSPPYFGLFLKASLIPRGCHHPAYNQFVPVYWWPNPLKSPCDLYFSIWRSKIGDCWLADFWYVVRVLKTFIQNRCFWWSCNSQKYLSDTCRENVKSIIIYNQKRWRNVEDFEYWSCICWKCNFASQE